MSTLPKHFLTPEEYLEIERKAEIKSEYYNGETFAMAGGSREHSELTFRLNLLIGQHLHGRPCRGFTSDMKVLAAADNVYTYPDLTVVCGEPRFADDVFDTLLNPTLIVEILSPSTEYVDRGKKSKWYRAIGTVREYLMIEQHVPWVELYRREGSGRWSLIEASGMDGAIELTSIGYTLRLRELYEGILSGEQAGA